MRQSLGPKKLRRLSKLLGLNLVAGSTRGNTHHHLDLLDDQDNVHHYYPGNTYPTGPFCFLWENPKYTQLEIEVLSGLSKKILG